MSWTEERVERLRQLHKDSWSYADIGNALGVTRGAALGKAHRLGLCERAGVVATARAKASSGPRRIGGAGEMIRRGGMRSFVKEPTYRDLPVETSPCAVSLMNLEPGACRWPVSGDGAATMFCGAVQANDGCSYCEAHKLRSIAQREVA